MTESLVSALVRAEDELRAHGWTGGRAFDELMAALEERLGLPATPTPEARAVAASLPLHTGEDFLGLAYERFFADLFKGKRGQFFTPQPIARLLVAHLRLEAGETVLDPTCGSGGLLSEAGRYGAFLIGGELDPRLCELARVAVALGGFNAEIRQADAFVEDFGPVDVVVANPPFSVAITDSEVLDRFDLGRGRRSALSDDLFVEAMESWVRPGGRAGVVLPWSVLVNPSRAAIRERLASAWVCEGVCELPEGVFRPFGGAAGRAALLWLRRGVGAPTPGRFARVVDPGYDVRLQRYRQTSSDEIDALVRGQGWTLLPPGAWVPPPAVAGGRALRELAELRGARDRPDAGALLVDLADADRSTGELRPRLGDPGPGYRVRIERGDVLVSRLRPNLGNVARAPRHGGPWWGSPEWVVLAAHRHEGWLLHALRTPAFRASLPLTGGQTRPRTSPAAVLDARVPWPGKKLASRVDALSDEIFTQRAALRERLLALQGAVDAFAAGELDEEALERALDEL